MVLLIAVEAKPGQRHVFPVLFDQTLAVHAHGTQYVTIHSSHHLWLIDFPVLQKMQRKTYFQPGS